jgi:hypothetical protein
MSIEPSGLVKYSHDSLKETCWIYFLYDKEELVYVGKTTRGVSRLLGHVNGINGYGLKDWTHYSYIQVERKDLDKIEKRMIREYEPKYNKQDNPKTKRKK